MGDVLICLPSSIVTANATLSLTAGTANAAFPLDNLKDGNPAKPFKATGTSCTIRATFGGSTTLRGIAFGPHNLAGATVAISNNGGMGSTSFPIPANREDGLSTDPFLQFTASSATQWTITITGAAANVAIGELYLIVSFQTIELLLGAQEAEAHKTIAHQTDYGNKTVLWLGVSQRRVRGTVQLNNNIATYLSQARDARGQTRPFILIMNAVVNDAMCVDLTTDERTVTWQTPASELGLLELEFLERQRGPAL